MNGRWSAPSAWPQRESDNLAGNHRILVHRVDGAQAVIPVSDDDPARGGHSHEQQRRKRLAPGDLLEVALDVRVAHTKERKAGRPEDVLRLELRDLRVPQLADAGRGSLLVHRQA